VAGLAQVGKLLGADGGDAHGDLPSSLETRSFWSSALAGAELDPQAPLSQVLTPRRGEGHAWGMIQATRTPQGSRNSIVLPPVSGFSDVVDIDCIIPTLCYLWAKNQPLPKRASTQAMMFARCGSAIW